MLVAGRQINVTRDGKLIALPPGTPCPEAATWPHDVLVRCMKVGQIVNVEQATPEQVAQAQAAQHAARSRSVAAKNVGQAEQHASLPAEQHAQPLEGGKPSTSKMPKAPAKPSTSSKAKKKAAA